MKETITEQLPSGHFVTGQLESGEEVGIDIDQVLVHDAAGVLVWLQFDALGREEV